MSLVWNEDGFDVSFRNCFFRFKIDFAKRNTNINFEGPYIIQYKKGYFSDSTALTCVVAYTRTKTHSLAGATTLEPKSELLPHVHSLAGAICFHAQKRPIVSLSDAEAFQ